MLAVRDINSLCRCANKQRKNSGWVGSHEFEVVGCDTGTRYVITNGTNMNIIELDKDGRSVRRWCFTPVGQLVQGDMLLAQKIALETMEAHALHVANSQRAA